MRGGALRLLAAAALALGAPAPGASGAAAAQAAGGPPVVPAGVAPTPPPSVESASVADGERITVYLITFGQGDLVWERFGHNALWIRDRSRHSDVAYNWGMFDFNQPNFLGRFLTGDTKYWMEGEDPAAMIRNYAALNRTVSVQELALTPGQRAALRDFVDWNERPENSYYRYDYFRDNCSTRVRDALDRVLGGQLRAATGGVVTNGTFRSHTRRLVAGDFPVYTGIQIALGRPADRPISAWEEMFLPVKMRDRLRTVRVGDGAGGTVPLVKSESQLYAAERPAELESPPRSLPLYLALGGGAALLIAALAAAAGRGSRPARAGVAVVGALWSLVAGVLGSAALLAWTATRHVFMYRNETLLQLEPLSLALVALLPLALWSGRGARAARLLAGVVAAAAVAGLLVKLLPVTPQRNGDVIALALPIHLALAWAAWRLLPAPPPAAGR
ncbi:MAG: DUF4105 domain-containing protein, partial [Gemmatimonadaceae bacterium]